MNAAREPIAGLCGAKRKREKPMGKKHVGERTLYMAALLFDSGKLGSPSYGCVVFNTLLRSGKLSSNGGKIVVSEGDILQEGIYDDVAPYLIRDHLCTVKKRTDRSMDRFYAVVLEDVAESCLHALDKRLWEECPAYWGMTSIDIHSTDARKQFWKGLVRHYSVERKVLTCFGMEEEGFAYLQEAREHGFQVNFDGFPPEGSCDRQTFLFSTRQSSFIRSMDQLEVIEGENDSDRGILEMNFSLVKEVEIAGVQLWKAIEDMDRCHISKNEKSITVDYLFTSIYQAAQGLERLLKILVELIAYNDMCDNKQKADALLMSHNHMGLYEFVNRYIPLSVGKNERKFLELVSRFYNKGRYSRFKYSENMLMELKLIREFGSDLSEEGFDNTVKHKYGRVMAKLAHTLYAAIDKISRTLNIYVYELNCGSAAELALNSYFGNDLYETLLRTQNSKRELLWYALKNGGKMELTRAGDEFAPLPFDELGIHRCLEDLILNRDTDRQIFDFVSDLYDEMVEEDKDKWKSRLHFINFVGNSNVSDGNEEADEE